MARKYIQPQASMISVCKNFEKYMGKIAPVNIDALKKAALYAYNVLKDIPQSERDAELFKSFAESI